MENKKLRALLDEQDWGYIAKALTLHAFYRFKVWNLPIEKGVKGFSPQEIALEAISLVYAEEWKWDPEKSDILTYLKFHVVNGLVANLARSKEVLLMSSSLNYEKQGDYDIEDELSVELFIHSVKSSLKDDKLGLDVLECLLKGMERKDICEYLKVELRDYDNAVRRVRSKVRKSGN